MLNFKKFNPDNFKTDMSGKRVKTNVIFVDDEDVLRFGYVSEYNFINHEYYIWSGDEYYYPNEETLYCEINIVEG
jgi:hypothetical protein